VISFIKHSFLLSYICVLNLCECELTDYFRECSHRNSIWFQRGTVSVQTLVSPGLFIIPGFSVKSFVSLVKCYAFRWSFVSHVFFSNSPFLDFSRTSFLFPRVQRLSLIIALNLWPAKRTWISYWKSPFLMIRTYVRIILCKFQSDRKNRLGHSFATTKTNVRASDWNRWISRHVWCCNQRNGFVH
jgi:hypothetical protein